VEEKFKAGMKRRFLKILCRALKENARQRHVFVVRLVQTHDKHFVFPKCFLLAQGKG
jgi:hypothetical protein